MIELKQITKTFNAGKPNRFKALQEIDLGIGSYIAEKRGAQFLIPNGMAFDDRGDLLICVGGNTNAGVIDPDIGDHHHLHCTACGKIIDFEYDRYADLEVPEAIAKQFKVVSRRVVLKGYCENCSWKH